MAHWKKRETLFAEYGLELTMPGHWQLRPSNDPERWHYRSADRKEQLTISRLERPGGENNEEVRMQRAVLRNRRAVELGFGRLPGLAFSEPEYGERNGMPSASYGGTAGEEEHRFQALLLFEDRVAWALFYEAFRLPEERAEEGAREIFDSIVFRKVLH